MDRPLGQGRSGAAVPTRGPRPCPVPSAVVPPAVHDGIAAVQPERALGQTRTGGGLEPFVFTDIEQVFDLFGNLAVKAGGVPLPHDPRRVGQPAHCGRVVVFRPLGDDLFLGKHVLGDLLADGVVQLRGRQPRLAVWRHRAE